MQKAICLTFQISLHASIVVTRYCILFTNFLTWYEVKNYIGDGLQSCNRIKKRLWHRCFPANTAKFLRTAFFIEHLQWFLLYISPQFPATWRQQNVEHNKTSVGIGNHCFLKYQLPEISTSQSDQLIKHTIKTNLVLLNSSFEDV